LRRPDLRISLKIMHESVQNGGWTSFSNPYSLNRYSVIRVYSYFIRSVYRLMLPWIVGRPIPQDRELDVHVYSISCERDLPEQVASIRSFIRYVGVPEEFTVISDGSYTEESKRLLCRINPCVKVVGWGEMIRRDVPECVLDFAYHADLSDRWGGMKLAVELSLPVDKTTIYADSDILFFPGAAELADFIKSDDKRPMYLTDYLPWMDKRILSDASEESNPVNAGFYLLKKPLDWKPLKRLEEFRWAPHIKTEQALVHLTMHHNNAVPFPRDRFILQGDDTYLFSDKYASKKIALRHYTRQTRHKFWRLGNLFL
jgi:hypothetical protein